MNKTVILCVDDENIIIRSLKRELMELFDCKLMIETAESGQEALELFSELLKDNNEVAVVISDYIMPEMKGDELLKRIHMLSPKTLKIMLTGRAVTEGIMNAVNNANLFKYIEKPWEKEELRSVVSEAIDSYFRSKTAAEENKRIMDTMKYLKEKALKKNLELADLNEKLEKVQVLYPFEKFSEDLLLFKEVERLLGSIKTNVSFLEKLCSEVDRNNTVSFNSYLEKEKSMQKINNEKLEKIAAALKNIGMKKHD